MVKKILGAHMEKLKKKKKKKKRKRELTLRILPRRNPLVDEPALKHGSWVITPRGNKLKMINFSKVMFKTYIKHAWFLFIEKISI